MLPSKIYTVNIVANQTVSLLVEGNFFKINAAKGLVSVASDFGLLDDLIPGQGLEKTNFKYLLLTDRSGADNTIKVFIGDENFIDLSNGTMTIVTNRQTQTAAFANTAKNVTSASSQLVAANLNRQYFLVQNKDAAGNIWVNFGGGAATAANGIKIPPGGSFELPSTQSTQAMQCIGDIAINANIVVVEG